MPKPKLEKPKKRNNNVIKRKPPVAIISPTKQPTPSPTLTEDLASLDLKNEGGYKGDKRKENDIKQSSNSIKIGIIQKIICAILIAIICSTVIRFV